MIHPAVEQWKRERALPPVAENAQQRRAQAAAAETEREQRRAQRVESQAAYGRGEASAPSSPEPVAAAGRSSGFGGYAQAFNPLNGLGPGERFAAAKNNFLEAPLGGVVRDWAAQQDWAKHRQGRTAEQAAAGLLATGVGVPMFLAAVDGLNGPTQSQGTIPLEG